MTLLWMILTGCGSDCEETTTGCGDTHTHSDSSSPSDTQNPGDSGDTTDTPTTGDGLLDVSGWDPYQTPTLEVTPVPLVPGGEAHITYRGDLAEGADLVLHYGFNGWNEVSGIDGLQALPDTGDEDWFVQADLTPTDDGAWTVTVSSPGAARGHVLVVTDEGTPAERRTRLPFQLDGGGEATLLAGPLPAR